MKLIAHRACIFGPDNDIENKNKSIKYCISKKFDVEIDVFFYKNKIYLGHDEPKEKINIQFLLENSKKLWIHCKNLDSLHYLISYKKLNVFYHQTDDFTLTSKKHIWTYPEKPTTNKSVIVCKSKQEHTKAINSKNIFGICSDYVGLILKNKN